MSAGFCSFFCYVGPVFWCVGIECCRFKNLVWLQISGPRLLFGKWLTIPYGVLTPRIQTGGEPNGKGKCVKGKKWRQEQCAFPSSLWCLASSWYKVSVCGVILRKEVMHPKGSVPLWLAMEPLGQWWQRRPHRCNNEDVSLETLNHLLWLCGTELQAKQTLLGA